MLPATGSFRFGCSFMAYSWKLPSYSGAVLLTVDDNFGAFLLTIGAFLLTKLAFSMFTYSWRSFFAYSGKVHLIRALRDCKQRSLTVSKKAPPTVSKNASPFHFWALRSHSGNGSPK